MLQIGAASLLQIRASVITNWGSYYKLGQPLLQNRAAITNWGKMYYKLRKVLQIRVIITNWGIRVTVKYRSVKTTSRLEIFNDKSDYILVGVFRIISS